MRDCTCVGSCRGAEGLGVGWNCVVDNGSVEDARVGNPSAPIERPEKSEGNSAKSEGNFSRPMTRPQSPDERQAKQLQWALDNIYTIARRELRRLERAGASEIESVAGDRWGHVVRLCEQAGCQGRGVLRDNGGSVLDGPQDAPETTNGR